MPSGNLASNNGWSRFQRQGLHLNLNMLDKRDRRHLVLLLLLAVAARRGGAKDVLPQVVRGDRLHDGEDDVVDAGQQHEEDPVGLAQGVPVGG